MRPARRRRTLPAVLISAVIHAVLIAIVWVQAPRLFIPRESSGPPQAIIPVLIMPSAPPPAGGPAGKPTPIRLHRRVQRFAPAEVPVAPLVVPDAEPPARPATAPGPPVIAPPPPDPWAVNGRQALRGVVGCANPNAVGMTLEERRKCEDKLAAGARDAPYLGTGIARDKARALDAAAARKEADFKYDRAQPTPNRAPGAQGSGQSAEDMARSLGSDRPKLTIPF